MAEVTAVLGRFLADRPRHRWGVADCCLMIGDWVALRRGFDPAPELRGAYSDRAGAETHFAGWGGLPRMLGRIGRRHRIPLTRAPVAGDVGALVVGDQVFGAIRAEHGWAAHLETGLALLSDGAVRVVAAWKV